MKTTNQHLWVVVCAILAAVSSWQLHADEPPPQADYSTQVQTKAENGIVNITSAPLEIPKNIINTTNESNIIFGFVGGTLKGVINTIGRVLTGTADLVTAPLPTQPVTDPNHVWDDFDQDTTYGDLFRLPEENQ